MDKLFSEEQLLGFIDELGQELGHVPSLRDMNKASGYPSGATFKNYFGSWNSAVEKAGFEATQTAYSDEELIEILVNKNKELGHTPRREDLLNDKKCPNPDTYQRHFGSYENALEKTGLKPNPKFVQIADEELLESLRDLAKELGRPPTYTEMIKAEGYPHPCTYKNRFGSWENAKERAGLEKERGIVKSKLITDLKEAYRILGHTPSYKEMEGLEDFASPRTYFKKFGSWKNAIKEAGLPQVKPGYSDKELKEHLSELTEELDRIPTFKDIWKAEIRGYPSPATFSNHFGNWKNIKEICRNYLGIESNYKIITPEIFSKAVANKFGVKNFREFLPNMNIVMDIFGYNDGIIDNVLDKEDRQLIYILEDKGLVKPKVDEINLGDLPGDPDSGKDWRIVWWVLNRKEILKNANEYDRGKYRKKEASGEMPAEKYDIYDSDDVWIRRQT